MEGIVYFHGGYEQDAIDAFLRSFAPVGSAHIDSVQSATVSIWNALRDTKLKPIYGTEIC